VVAPFLGDPAALPGLVDRLSSLPQGGLGSPATVSGAGTAACPVDPTWSASVRANNIGRPAVRETPLAPAQVDSGTARSRTRCDKCPKPQADGPVRDADGEEGSGGVEDALSAAGAVPRRASSCSAPALTLDSRMMEALRDCVRRACGLPSSTPIGRRASTVSAVMNGEPQSRSRALLLRVGSGKAVSAVLWSSHRRGILCFCFAARKTRCFSRLPLTAASANTRGH